MKCSKCGKEMRKGYLFSSKDGAFSFANEVPGVFENAKNAEGFVEITKLKPSHRTRVEANCCEECRMIVIYYYEFQTPDAKTQSSNFIACVFCDYIRKERNNRQ